MKKILPFIVFAIISIVSRAQIAKNEVREKIAGVSRLLNHFCDSVRSYVQTINDLDQLMSAGSYRSYIDQYFTYLSYNRGVLPSGSSAALELSNNSTQLNLSVSRKFESPNLHGPISLITGGLKAKIGDGISQIFSGGNVNSGTSLFGNFAVLPGRIRHKIAAVVKMYDEYGNPIPKEYEKLKTRRQEYVESFCQRSNEGFYRKYTALTDCWQDSIGRIFATSEPCSIAEVVKKDEEIEKELTNSGLLTLTPSKIASSLENEYASKMFDIEANSGAWLWIKLFWWSGGVTYTRQSYDTYDNTSPLAARLDKKDFDQWEINITANWFKQALSGSSLIQSSYFNISYQPRTTNSFLNLKSVDISRVVLGSLSPADTVYSVLTSKKAKDITGKAYRTGWDHTFSSTATGMFGSKQNSGVNLRAWCIFSTLTSPMFYTHLGALLRFKSNSESDEKKEKAKVNFELFLEFADMTDVSKSGKSVWQNKIIGINTNVPFNKIFFK